MSVDVETLADVWWKGRLGPRRGCGAVWIPVGAGRRRFLRRAADRASSATRGTVWVLVVTNADELAALWRSGLQEQESAEAAGVGFVVEVAGAIPDVEGPVDVLVIDEPSSFSEHELDYARSIPHQYLIELELGDRTTGDRSAGRAEKNVGVPLSPFDYDIGQMIAGLLDGELEQRRPLTESRWFSRAMGVGEVRLVHRKVQPLQYRMMAWQLQRLLDTHDPSDLGDAEGGPVPVWTSIDVPGGAVQVPLSIRVVFPAGTVTDLPCGVSISPLKDGSFWFGFCVLRSSSDSLDVLTGRLQERDESNPYREQTLEVIADESDIDVRLAPASKEDRSGLLLPDEIWHEVDVNISNLFANRQMLTRLGLGMNRGLLLTGPPGTGKTHLTRVIASELTGRVTVLFVAPKAMSKYLSRIYRLAEQLSPSLVVLEDVDLAVSNREEGGSSVLNEFLSAVDGVMTEHTGIVTVATTNDPRAIDEAAKRAARFDRIIDVPLPPPEGRARIWRRYLDGVPGQFDVARLVRATRGGSGAAILTTNGNVDTDTLVELAKDRGLEGRQHIGHYLSIDVTHHWRGRWGLRSPDTTST